jgi:hypothetical protein
MNGKATKFKTTREMVFGFTDSNKGRTQFKTYPAGTEVYASKNKTYAGQYNLRICGTLMTQVASKSCFEIAEGA